MPIFASFLLFVGLSAWLWNRNRGLGHAGLLISLLYMVSFACSIIVVVVEGRESTWSATVYFIALLLLLLMPLVSRVPASLDNCPKPEWPRILTPYAWGIALLGCYGTITTTPAAIRLLFSGQLGDLRDAMYRGSIDGTSNLSLSSFAASGAWPVCMVLCLFSYIARQSSPVTKVLALGSLSGATSILALAGRAGFVYFGMFFLLIVAVCWPLIRYHRPRMIRRLFLSVFAIICGIIVFTIYIALTRKIGSVGTFSVVSNNSTLNAIFSIVIYIGSGLANFQDFWFVYDDFGKDLHGQRCFPVYCGVLERLGVIGDYDAQEINVIYKPFYDAYNLEHAAFHGFQRDLMMDFGRLGTLLGACGWALTAWYAKRRYELRIDLLSVMLMCFLGSVPVLGIFFLSYAEIPGNVSLAAFLGTIAFLKATQVFGKRRGKVNTETPGGTSAAAVPIR